MNHTECRDAERVADMRRRRRAARKGETTTWAAADECAPTASPKWVAAERRKNGIGMDAWMK